jgi:hypothetical protein
MPAMTKTLWFVALVGFVGCGSSGTAGPSIAISSPSNGQAVTLGSDPMKSVPVSFTTTAFTLMAPGSANCTTGSCGHAHLFIDGSACTPTGMPYNNAGAASPIDALFKSCATPTGSHTISIELHNNDHSPVQNANGATIAATVTVTAQ